MVLYSLELGIDMQFRSDANNNQFEPIATWAAMTQWNSLPEGFYEALLSVIREGYPGKEIKPLTDAELEAIDRDMQEIAELRDDDTVDWKTETNAYLQEIVRVTLENSDLLFEE